MEEEKLIHITISTEQGFYPDVSSTEALLGSAPYLKRQR